MLLIRPLSAGDAGYLYVAEIQDVIQDVLRGMCVRICVEYVAWNVCEGYAAVYGWGVKRPGRGWISGRVFWCYGLCRRQVFAGAA